MHTTRIYPTTKIDFGVVQETQAADSHLHHEILDTAFSMAAGGSLFSYLPSVAGKVYLDK